MSDSGPRNALADLATLAKGIAEYRVPDFRIPEITVPRMPLPAESMYRRLCDNIAEFEKQLDSEHEIGARVVSFGLETIYIDDLGYHGTDLIIFYGSAGGKPVRLLQHISQTNLLLVALQKRGPEPKRLGFKFARSERAAPDSP